MAAKLDEARTTGVAISQLTVGQELTLDTAYEIQHAGIALRVAAGDPVAGVKLGFTSKAKAEQMGVSDVIIGTLTQAMAVEGAGTVDISRAIHPRVEPEIALLLGELPESRQSGDDLLAAVTHVAPALEVIDSRYRDFRFSLVDVVADNASASRYVVGSWVPISRVRSGLDLADLEVELVVDGRVVDVGSSSDILGDPLLAPAAVARLATRYGHPLQTGAVIMAGAATAAAPLPAAARVECRVAGLGSVSFVTTASEAG